MDREKLKLQIADAYSNTVITGKDNQYKAFHDALVDYEREIMAPPSLENGHSNMDRKASGTLNWTPPGTASQTTGFVDPGWGEPSYPKTPNPEVQSDGYSLSDSPDTNYGCTVEPEELEHQCIYHSILDKLDKDENRLLDEIERISNLRESIDDPTIQKVLELLEYING